MCLSTADASLSGLVEPRLGTSQTRWIHFSSACRPQGMVSLSPDTRIDGDWGGGYAWADDHIVGFSHIHDWQVAGVLVMPATRLVDPSGGIEPFAARFSHHDETCMPGDHRVRLRPEGNATIGVELTATMRVGLHRYTFDPADDAWVLIDLASTLGPSEMAGAELRRVSATGFEGSVVNQPTYRRPKPVTVYFAIAFDDPHGTVGLGAFREGLFQASDMLAGDPLRAFFDLGKTSCPVTMRVAISYTSAAAARDHLEREVQGKSFEQVRAEARADWDEQLGRINVEGGDPTRRARFYTDLFFALAGRRTCSDARGTYLDQTGETPVVRQIPLDSQTGQPRYRHFNSDAFWGCQWSLNLLWSLAYPELVDEFCRCFVDMGRNGGLIPRGPSGGNYTFVMTSAGSTPLLVTAILQGLYRPEDPHAVYRLLQKNHAPGGLMSKCGYEHDSCTGGGLEDYLSLGFIPEDLADPPHGFHHNGAAQTMEHCFNDWCLAQLARFLGHHQDADRYDARSRNWRHLYDSAVGLARPRNRDGTWLEPYSPDAGLGWTEAGGWNYTYYPAHDVAGMIEVMGGAEPFAAKLDQVFASCDAQGFYTTHGEHETMPLDFGNEPALATPFLFAAAGDRKRTDHWARRVMDVLKSGNAPTDGFGGDEDQGIMGAWGCLTAMGLSAIDAACGEPPRLVRHAPLFDRVTIQRGDTGQTWTLGRDDHEPLDLRTTAAPVKSKRT